MKEEFHVMLQCTFILEYLQQKLIYILQNNEFTFHTRHIVLKFKISSDIGDVLVYKITSFLKINFSNVCQTMF